jgi:hypothetical protein
MMGAQMAASPSLNVKLKATLRPCVPCKVRNLDIEMRRVKGTLNTICSILGAKNLPFRLF